MSLLDDFTQFNLTYICDLRFAAALRYRTNVAVSARLTSLLLTLSREELLERFAG